MSTKAERAAYMRDWYAKRGGRTPEEKAAFAAYRKAYKIANRDKVNAYARSEGQKEANRAKWRRHYARKMGAEGSHTGADVAELMRLQRGLCAVCKDCLPASYHVDHIVALVNGGRNDRANLQLLCPPCNCQKNDRDPVEFMQSRGFLL